MNEWEKALFRDKQKDYLATSPAEMRNHEFRDMPTCIVASFSPATDQVIGAEKLVYEIYEESEFCHIRPESEGCWRDACEILTE